MAQKDKVLKVSFGAFSCTLEGFDDPVETLKEVTEYFRALSASDPGFGDEPKLPDTENLARLVQQDDSKSVNIRTNESGSVMLRAEDAEFVPTETEDDDLSAPLSENDKGGAGTKKRRSATGSPAEGSVADKLQRIRAVVSSTEAEPSSDDLAEDDSQTARFFAGQIKETPPETATPEPEDASDDASASSDDASYRNGDDEILFSLGKIRTEPDDDTDAADDPAPQSESAQSTAEDAESPEEQTTETETNAAEPDPKDEADTPHDQLMKQIMNSLKGTGSDQQAFPPDTARQNDSQAEASPKDDADSEDDFSQPYVLRPDQMISDGTDEDADPLPEASAPQIQKVQKSIPERDEIDLARLMAATEERMGAPETASQRETYSQLRAAAAANTGAGANGQGNDTEAAYHNDLASVERPSRPTSGGAVRPEPSDDTPPLQLVAEQRVSASGESAIAGPVRPRRVYPDMAAHDPAPRSDGDDFARYAKEQGTTDLPDILEAAAAYLSFVEGRSYFTRPQLMNTLRQSGSDAFQREDTLRAFGALLRQGKITKVGSGRYAASDRTGFRPAGQSPAP